jgi:hypothetical protein
MAKEYKSYDGYPCTCKDTCSNECSGTFSSYSCHGDPCVCEIDCCTCEACGARAAEIYANGQYEGVDFNETEEEEN